MSRAHCVPRAAISPRLLCLNTAFEARLASPNPSGTRRRGIKLQHAIPQNRSGGDAEKCVPVDIGFGGNDPSSPLKQTTRSREHEVRTTAPAAHITTPNLYESTRRHDATKAMPKRVIYIAHTHAVTPDLEITKITVAHDSERRDPHALIGYPLHLLPKVVYVGWVTRNYRNRLPRTFPLPLLRHERVPFHPQLRHLTCAMIARWETYHQNYIGR